MTIKSQSPVVLTIAGSDSGGGAGVQADLKTFASMDVFGVSAITAITAQNPRRIKSIFPLSTKTIREQVRTVCEYFNVAAVKTGMLYNEQIVFAVAEEIRLSKIPIVVVDPICKATSGKTLLTVKAFHALCTELLPLATLITPNVPEAEMFLKCRIKTHAGQCAAAANLSTKFRTACVVKGGHMPGNEIIDVLCHEGKIFKFKSRRIDVKTHGTGCVYSAALAACLARGMNLRNACAEATKHVYRSVLQKQASREIPS